MEAFISSSSKIMVAKYVGDKGMLSVSRDFCMNKQERLFLKKSNQKLMHLTRVERKGSSPVTFNSSQEEMDDGESETQELNQPKTVHVRVQLQKECSFGEKFLIVGDNPVLGSWEPSKAVPLSWSDGHIWTVELDIPIGKSIQFKFILKEISGIILWQPGPDRTFTTWETEKIISVCANWENAELQKIIEKEPAAFRTSNMESSDGFGMLLVADILSCPVEKPVSHASEGSTSTGNEFTMADNLMVETQTETDLAENISLEEKHVAIVAENAGSSYDNNLVNASSKAPHNNEVIDTVEDKEVVSSNNTSMGQDILGNNGKTAIIREHDLNNFEGDMIYHVGEPVLVPGLTPFPTGSAEASIPNDDSKYVDDFPSNDSNSSNPSSQKQQSVNKQSQDIKDQNGLELDGTQKAEDAIHLAETTEVFVEEEQTHHELEERSYLAIEEKSNTKLFGNKVLHKDIQWGRNTLHKLLLNLGLL